jgi:hypothetical protein
MRWAISIRGAGVGVADVDDEEFEEARAAGFPAPAINAGNAELISFLGVNSCIGPAETIGRFGNRLYPSAECECKPARYEAGTRS